ncbi:MAG: alpha/beta hydrolase [Gammaproteobacteria bacterium]|nr:alpha/beta hydrolase [Gammaproteobacteria bacterium]MBU1443677.1 alpha/beta hydrolase [Gammaproteobacteria bacterium]
MNIRRAFADLSVGQVHYAQCGDIGAPPVLLLHQSPRSWAEYRHVLPLLGPRFRAVAMDTAGFGDSAAGTEPASIEHWAQVAVELLDALGMPAAHVVGHHTGGVIAVEMAANHGARVRSLVLSSTPFIDEGFRRARAQRPPIDEVETSADGSHLTALWRQRQGFYPPGRTDLLEAFVLDALKARGGPDGHLAVATYRMEESVARIAQPTLIVRATDDPFAAPHAADWLAHLPQARVVDIAGGMVPLPDQMPEAFASAVVEFLGTLP